MTISVEACVGNLEESHVLHCPTHVREEIKLHRHISLTGKTEIQSYQRRLEECGLLTEGVI